MWKYIPLLGAIFNSLLVILVLLKGARSTALKVYVLLGCSIAIWNLGTYFMFCVQTEAEAFFWARFLQMGVIFIPLTLYHLSMLIGQIRVERSIRFLYAFCFLLALSNLTGHFISGARSQGYAYYSVVGPGFYLFLLSFGLPFRALSLLAQKLPQFSPLQKTRVLNLIWAQGIRSSWGGMIFCRSSAFIIIREPP